MRLTRLFTLLMSLCLGTSLAFARGGGRHHEEHKDALSPIERQFSPEKIKELNLSEEQMQKIKAIRQESHSQVKAMKEEMKTAKAELKKLIKSQASDAEILKAFEDFETKKAKFGKIRMENMLKARALLNEEQKKKLFEAKE